MRVAALILCVAVSLTQPARSQAAPPLESPAAGGKSPWAFRLPSAHVVRFQGAPSTDGTAGATGGMLYPAPSPAGFIAAVITHGLINSAARSREAAQLQEAADGVLAPYREVLSSFQHGELFALAERRIDSAQVRQVPEGETPNAAEWLHVSEPLFSMTQDQSALIYDSPVVIYAPDAPDKPVFQGAVRVVSSPLVVDDRQAHWQADQGLRLKTFAAHLYAHAILLARAEAETARTRAEADEPPFRTVRYMHGGAERVERARVLEQACGRLLLKTLRGGLLSVPTKAEPAGDAPVQSCPAEKFWIALANPQFEPPRR